MNSLPENWTKPFGVKIVAADGLPARQLSVLWQESGEPAVVVLEYLDAVVLDQQGQRVTISKSQIADLVQLITMPDVRKIVQLEACHGSELPEQTTTHFAKALSDLASEALEQVLKDAPEWVNYVGQNSNGSFVYFELEPRRDRGFWCPQKFSRIEEAQIRGPALLHETSRLIKVEK